MRFTASTEPERCVRLSPLERGVLNLLIRCYSNKEIAAVLGVDPGTVKNYLRALSLALNCRNRAELVRWVLLYPSVLSGAGAPVAIHSDGCDCGASYCQASGIELPC